MSLYILKKEDVNNNVHKNCYRVRGRGFLSLLLFTLFF